MASLLGVFGRGGKAEEREVHGVLRELDREKKPVRMEIEKANVRFTTMLVFKANSVVVAKPQALERMIKSGEFIRFKVPGQKNRAIRMEITTPNFNLKNGAPVFICQPPAAFAKSAHRQTERFDTRRFSNIHLRIDGFSEKFRIVDLSVMGCRFQALNGEPARDMPKGKPLPDAWIQMGDRGRIDLSQITPRTHQAGEVGVEFSVKTSAKTKKMLESLVDSLDRQQKESIRSQSF